MLDTILDAVSSLVGFHADDPNGGQMAVRAVLTFAVLITFFRLGSKRALGKGTAFDNVVAIMIGSVMSGAITGSTPMLRTWLAGLVLIGIHWALATAAFHLDWFGTLIKGNRVLLVEGGEVRPEGMREGSVTERELRQALRSQGMDPDPSSVERAYLERDGSISVVPRDAGPRVLEVTVEHGVQTVRIVID